MPTAGTDALEETPHSSSERGEAGAQGRCTVEKRDPRVICPEEVNRSVHTEEPAIVKACWRKGSEGVVQSQAPVIQGTTNRKLVTL